MKPYMFVFALTLLFSGCSGQSKGQETAGSPKTQAENPSPASAQQVRVSRVEKDKLATTLTLPAQLLPYEVVDVYPKVTGFIESLRVDRGSHVRAGEIMVHLSAPELLAQRAQAEAEVRAAEAQLPAAEAKLASDHGTYLHLAAAAKTPGVVAGNDLLVAEQTAASDKAQVEAAKHRVSAARDTLRSIAQLESYLDIRAPFDGVVTARYLHPGALVGPNAGRSGTQPIVQVEVLDRLRLAVPVPEAYDGAVSNGQQVEFTVPSYPGQVFRAPIARISHMVNQETRTMAVELDVLNKDARLTPGAFASVQWPIHRDRATLFVPASAVTNDLQRTFVVRVRNGHAEWVDVTTGVTAGGKIEVFGDLREGDEVVTNATDAIRPGMAVTVQGT
jgi:membrane fusion protein, multidrug efflux system